MRPYRPLSLKHPALRRRVLYRRNARAPKGYTVKGVTVTGVFHGANITGTIEEQMFGGPGSMFRVKFTKPVPIEQLRLPPGPVSVTFLYRAPGSGEGVPILSEAEQFLDSLRRLRLLGEKNGKLYAVGGIFRWTDLEIPINALKKGQPIELIDHKVRHVSEHGRDHAVRFVKTIGTSMLVFLPEPATFMDIEDLLDLSALHPSHISKDAYFMPFDGYKVLYKAGIKMPPAKKAKYAGKWVMELNPTIPLKAMADLLRQYHRVMMKDEPDLPVKSVWYTLMKTVMFHMAPIRKEAINHIRPMREDVFYGLVIPAEQAMEGL